MRAESQTGDMEPPLVDALLGAFGPFLFPVLLFAAGAVGYGVLFLVARLRGSSGTVEWGPEPSESGEDAGDADRHEG